MKTDQFLRHHGIAGNPFSEEDAQTDTVFKKRCLGTIHHPAWDKFFGSPADPSTALVFGEKGSGKTALRLQAMAELDAYNQAHPGERVFVISYDDFNPYLDHFRAATKARDTAQALTRWRLQDHMDAILAQGVTRLIDLLNTEKIDLTSLSLDQRRDLLLLAALYDQSTGEPIDRRWDRLRRRSGFRPLWSRRDLQIGFGTTLVVVVLLALFPGLRALKILPWFLLPIVLGWIYWGWRLARAEWFAADIRRGLRVLSRDPSALRWELLWFKPAELGGQPLPTAASGGGEERYELLRKFQGVLHTLGFAGIIVLIDRVDEPQQIEGDPRKIARIDLAVTRSQVPAAPGYRHQALASDRAGLLPRKGRQGVLRPGASRQAESDQAPALDRPVTVRPGGRPAPRLRPRHRALGQRRRTTAPPDGRRHDRRRQPQGRSGKPPHPAPALQVPPSPD